MSYFSIFEMCMHIKRKHRLYVCLCTPTPRIVYIVIEYDSLIREMEVV